MKDEVLYEFIPELINEEVPQQNGSADAVQLLKKDHREVQDLLKRALKVQNKQEQHRLAMQICTMLKVHSQLEEQLVYPILQEEDSDEAIESYLEHALLKMVIKEVESTSAKDQGLSPRLKVLNELVKHHVKEEETVALPELERADDVDLQELGMKLQERKQQLEKRLSTKNGSKTSSRKKASSSSSKSGTKNASSSRSTKKASGRAKSSTKSKTRSRGKSSKSRKAA